MSGAHVAPASSAAMPAADYFAIRNTLATYCIALDSRQWELLNDVFSADVESHYPFREEAFHGVAELSRAIQGRLKHITSQHALTTQHIIIAADGATAQAVTYFTGVHFGQGRWAGQQVTAWGSYTDSLKADGTGRWLITNRRVAFMGRLGEERVLQGETDEEAA